ncbi:MFS transporter [Thermoactinospora rubra]|uniref:MFS transporter n=1 Tax=Thermoactinospora rubra TaxID=1088767 RepID=UPI000A11889B|nr:MFS transporter [Thermoactinospora rubra]
MYAVLFADAGLSPGQISSLLVIWSVTGFLLEIPSGAWADAFSRRTLLVIAPLLQGAGYALWTFLPSYPAFAAGFVLWGAAGALASGSFQALAYEELARLGRESDYARVIGRCEVASSLAVLAATALAAPVLAAGGYPALGVASVAVPLVTAAIARTLPEHRSAPGEDEDEPSVRRVLRSGMDLVRRAPATRRALLVAIMVYGFTASDEYLPLLARDAGATGATLPLLVLVVTVGEAAGGWLAGRGTRWAGPLLAVAALCLAGGAALRHPAGFVLLAAAFGIFRWAVAWADTRLQERLEDATRATVTSLSGFGTEVVTIALYAAIGVGSAWLPMWLLLVLAALPYLVIAAALRRRPPGGPRRARPARRRGS